MVSCLTTNPALLGVDTSHGRMALNSTPGHRQSSGNQHYHCPLRNHHPLRRTRTHHLSRPNYIYSDYQTRLLLSLQRSHSVRRGGVWLGCAPPVPFGPFFVPASSKRFGRRKYKRRRHLPIERLRARTSTDLPSRLGEKERALVFGVLHRPLAWTASRVGERMTRASE